MTVINFNGDDSLYTPVGVTSLGTIVFDNVQFPAGKYINIEGEEVNYEAVVLDSVSLLVNRAKNIVKTNVEGLSGTIKEFIASGDYTIDLNAIIAPDLLRTIPAEILTNKVVALDDIPEAIEIQSKFLLNTFGITSVVVESIAVEKHESDSYRVRLLMLSDMQADLKDFG